MITATPEEWSNPLGKWFDKALISDVRKPQPKKIKVQDSVTMIDPYGREIEVAELNVKSYLAMGLSLKEVENE